jgi:hypothetical protein
VQLKPLVLLKGTATFFPGVMRFACGGSGGTNSARYCYATWLRHLLHVRAAGFDTHFHTVAELGPGDSLGIGLSAMLTGADRYFAFDALRHARTSENLRTLDQLVEIFARREDIPDAGEFPEIWPPIRSTQFPSAIFENGNLAEATAPARVAAIRKAIESGRQADIEIRYCAPWNDASLLQSDSVDFVFSQAVLEHVEDMDATYDALFRWLRPGGVMSHQIDFRSHSLTRDWYGHWTLSPWLWRLVKGRRPYLINRHPASVHIKAMQRHGFEIVQQIPQIATPPRPAELAREFCNLNEDDLRTSALFVIARKPGAAQA